MRISLANVFVDNPDKALKFYTEVLGFVTKLCVPEAAVAVVASPEEPDGIELLLEPNGNPIATTYQDALYRSRLPALVFRVDDIVKEVSRLKALGVVFCEELTRTEWGTQAVFDDTCGNLIQLTEV